MIKAGRGSLPFIPLEVKMKRAIIVLMMVALISIMFRNSADAYWQGAGDGVATCGIIQMEDDHRVTNEIVGFYPDFDTALEVCGGGNRCDCTTGPPSLVDPFYWSGCYYGQTSPEDWQFWHIFPRESGLGCYSLIDDIDEDRDGVIDDNDLCQGTSSGEAVDSNGCSCSQGGFSDTDGDGVGDVCDNCPSDYNPNQADADDDQIGDACEDCSVILTTDKDSLVPGDTATVTSKTSPEDLELEWIVTTIQGDADVELSYSSDGKSATIEDVTGEGVIKIHAQSENDANCGDDVIIEIGTRVCKVCPGCESRGSAKIDNGSIDVKFRLGKSARGRSAGNIYLKADTPDPANATPQILEAYDFGPDLEIIKDGDNLRQVIAPESFADIVVIDTYSYNIFFYPPDALGSKTGGVYEVVSGSVAIVTWTIENPDASPTVYNRLNITETKGTSTKVYEYIWDEAESTWSLSKGNGLKVVTKKEEIVAGNRVETKIVKNDQETVASKVKTTYKEIIVNEETKEIIIEKVIDPDGDALTTAKTYYEEPSCTAGSCGRIESQVNPDGSWVRYAYDSDGRKTAEISSWLDAPAGSAAASARALYYDYTPLSGDSNASEDQRRPRTMTETILGTVVAKTYYVYQIDGSSGDRTEIMERSADSSASFGDAGNQRTATATYAYSTDLAQSGLVKSITYPDGRMDSYTYEYGIYSADIDPAVPGTFSTGQGDDVRKIVVHGTVGQPSGIANKTTREISISNRFGREMLSEVQVYNGSGYERMQWTVKLYDDEGHVTDVYKSDGSHTETDWGCCSKQSETDAQGIVIDYSVHDDLERVLEQVKHGTLTNADISTTYTYDAEGRRLTETISSGSLTLTSSTEYDLAGRIDLRMDAAGLVTAYDYTQGGKVTTVTLPGGATEITARYMDGRIKSIIGSGVIPQYYSYGVNFDGTQWIRVNTGSETSAMWEETTVDMLGRTVSIEKPGYFDTETTGFFYDANGRLEKTTTPGQADILYEYDELGNQTKSGLDINANGYLDTVSSDRITGKDTSYVKISSDWWQQTLQQVYATENDGTATTINTQRTQISGLGSGGKTAETVTIDIHGNQTIEQVFIDRANKTETRRIDYPDAAINSESVNINGLLFSSLSKSGILTTYEYDDLGRRIGIIDPRVGKSIIHYNDKGQVDYIEDPDQNLTLYTYDPDSGRKIIQTDTLGFVTRFAYNNRGQLVHIWGDAADPVEYVYDSFGRVSELHTFRNGFGWEGETWPAGSTGDADITTWHYQESTGLLASKQYADIKSVIYSYTLGGKLYSRTWARTDGGSLVTTYSYDSYSGELLNIDYSDATPDITFTYDRLGRQKTVADAVGNRTFAYKPDTLQLDYEDITGLYNRVITRKYETSGTVGRVKGLNIGSGYSVDYGYEADTGRFSSVAWNAGGASDTAAYSYVPNSDLLQQLTTSNGQQTIFEYEPKRNLKTQVKNEFNTQLISQYDYQYNELGLRKSVETTGDWQGTPSHQSSIYTSNALNQYTEITTTNDQQTTDTLTYDDDGNLSFITTSASGPLYTYDAENRLIAVEPQSPASGDKKVEFIYDYMGRRVQKKVYTYQAGTCELSATSLYVYDGWNLIEERETRDSQSATRYYIWGLDLSQSLKEAGGIGGLIATVDDSSSTMYYYQYDANGNVVQLVNSSDGSIAAAYDYYTFGGLISATGTEADNNPFRFSTKYYDSETGLYYYGHRYYSPELGRWLTRDPLGEEGALNLYASVLNNPINAIDPLGLIVEADPFDPIPSLLYSDRVIRWRIVGKGAASVVFGTVAVVGGAYAASTPTGIGQFLGVTSVLFGSSSISFGVSQIIAGFTDNEIPFMGTKEAIIQGTSSGLAQKNLLAANELLDIIPDVASGRLNVPPSKLKKAISLIEYGLSIGKSVNQIQQELEKADLLESTVCEQ